MGEKVRLKVGSEYSLEKRKKKIPSKEGSLVKIFAKYSWSPNRGYFFFASKVLNNADVGTRIFANNGISYSLELRL